MSDLLRDYVDKRRRAMFHYDLLRKQVEGFANAERDPVHGQLNADATQHVFKVPLEGFDPDWTLIVGEFAYNTRASLDYLITALVRSTGKEENNGNEFPIYLLKKGERWETMPSWWDTSREVGRDLNNTPPGTRAALKRLQPFHGVPMHFPMAHPLWALSVLSNRDKHRRLNVLARRAAIEFVDGEGKPIFQGPPLDTRITERNEGNTYTVTLTIRPDYADVDMNLFAAHDVALHEPPELIGDLIETLTGINQFIDARVVPTVKTLL